MSDIDLIEAVKVLRDEVLDTAERGDRAAQGGEVFDAVLQALSIGGDSVPGLDLHLHDSVTTRLAWGDSEEVVLTDAEVELDRLMVAIDRSFDDPADRMVLIEAATQVGVAVSRVISLAAIARQARDRAARMREELAQRQLKEVLDKQRTSIVRLEHETRG
jgi:hypothetical protein